MNQICKIVVSAAVASLAAFGPYEHPAEAAVSGPVTCTVNQVIVSNGTGNTMLYIGCANGSTTTYYIAALGASTANSCNADSTAFNSYVAMALSAKLTASPLTIYYTANANCGTSSNINGIYDLAL